MKQATCSICGSTLIHTERLLKPDTTPPQHVIERICGECGECLGVVDVKR